MTMLDLLDDLKLPRAIATSSRHESVNRHLGPHNLLPRFDHIVAREDYTEPKPSPMPYLTAAHVLASILRNAWRWKILITAFNPPPPPG